MFRKLVIILLFIVSFFLTLNAQTEDKPKGKLIDKVIKKDGWKLPSIKDFNILKGTEFLGNSSNKLLEVKYYTTNKDIDFTVDYYVQNALNNLVIFSNLTQFFNLTVYKSNNKILAYGFSGDWVAINKTTRKAGNKTIVTIQRALIARIVRRYFVDTNGDGKFETMYQTENKEDYQQFINTLISLAETKPS